MNPSKSCKTVTFLFLLVKVIIYYGKEFILVRKCPKIDFRAKFLKAFILPNCIEFIVADSLPKKPQNSTKNYQLISQRLCGRLHSLMISTLIDVHATVVYDSV